MGCVCVCVLCVLGGGGGVGSKESEFCAVVAFASAEASILFSLHVPVLIIQFASKAWLK